MIAYQTVILAKAIIIIFEHQTVISLKQCRRVHTYMCNARIHHCLLSYPSYFSIPEKRYAIV